MPVKASWVPKPSATNHRLITPCDQSISYLMRPEPVQVSRVRQQARRALPAWGLAEHAELAELIITELVTNAIVHGSGLIEIRLAYESGSLTVYVYDQGDGRPVRRHPNGDWEYGRGLELIDGLVALYGGIRGVFGDDDRRGKTVFVTLPLTRDPEGIR
ncbi:MAG TPA: ATP-binding protein [Streptosporangiaceae bacterium]|jgi:K+-sensing histidine kinase KdpD